MNRLVRMKYRDFPQFVSAFESRPRRYNESLEEIERLEREGKAFVIRPQQPVTVSRVERDNNKLMDLYHQGTAVIESQMADLRAFLKN